MIRFGIVGAGGIAEKFATDIKVAKGAMVTAVASRSYDKAKKFAKRFGIDNAFGSYEEMARSNLIDAVYIATPHNFHKQQSIMCMNHHKHVLCEKPIAVSQKEFEEMVEVARSKKVLLMEAMWTKFLPVTVYLREIIKNETYGKLVQAKLVFGRDLMGIGDQTQRWLNPNLAAGSLLDLGVYPVSYMWNLTNEKVASIEASGILHETGIDLSTRALVTFESGLTIELVSDQTQNLESKAFLTFEQGTVDVDHFWSSEKLIINNEEKELKHRSGGFEYQIESFVETLRNLKLENHLMTHQESRNTLKILDEIRKQIGLIYPFEKKE